MTKRAQLSTSFQHRAIESLRSGDLAAISLLRCLFAAIIIAVVIYQTEGHVKGHFQDYLAAITYFIFSLIYLARAKMALYGRDEKLHFWIDLIAISYVLAAMQMHESVFFALLLFPIIVASRLATSFTGLVVTLVATILYVGTAIPALESSHLLLVDVASRSLCLIFLGGIVFRWATAEEHISKRLKFLLEVSDTWNPRLGMDRAIIHSLKRLVQLYKAETGLLVLKHSASEAEWKMYLIDRNGKSKISTITAETAQHLMQLPPSMSTAYAASKRLTLWRTTYFDKPPEINPTRKTIGEKCDSVANILDTTSFVTTPYSQQNGISGRIYITSEQRTFTRSDFRFLINVSKVIAVIHENMCLTEQLISKATDYERLQISRDMHDTTIQPYIGLKIALEALLRQAKDTPLESRIAELTNMASITISNLRTYTSQLRERNSMPGENLIAAVSKQAEIYTRFYGITLKQTTELNAPINGQVAAELLQIISEGLSNILRHTSAKRGRISIESTSEVITLVIANENEVRQQQLRRQFLPKSIYERVTELGGGVEVHETDDHYTSVVVKIPNLAYLET